MFQDIWSRYTTHTLLYKNVVTGSILVAGTTVALGSLHAAPVVYDRSDTDTYEVAQTETLPVAMEVHLPDTPLQAVIAKRNTHPSIFRGTTQKEYADDTPRTDVPFFSQFTDISSKNWQKVSCGIVSLAMLIEYYKPNSIVVETLLDEGIAADAFLPDAGWTHAGLIGLAKKYGLTGASHDLSGSSMSAAFSELTRAVEEGPVMVSVHYTFDPKNPIPHLVVVNDVVGDTVYYNDPAEPQGGGNISAATFKSAWKKRYIRIAPLS